MIGWWRRRRKAISDPQVPKQQPKAPTQEVDPRIADACSRDLGCWFPSSCEAVWVPTRDE